MKFILIVLSCFIFVGCEKPLSKYDRDNEVFKEWKLDCNQKLINASSESHIGYNYVTRPMREGEFPETYLHRSGNTFYRIVESRCGN